MGESGTGTSTNTGASASSESTSFGASLAANMGLGDTGSTDSAEMAEANPDLFLGSSDKADSDQATDTDAESKAEDTKPTKEKSVKEGTSDKTKNNTTDATTVALSALQSQIAQIQQQMNAMYEDSPDIESKEATEEVQDDFKELSQEELAELQEDDPRAAMEYLVKLNQRLASQVEQKLSAEVQKVQEEQQLAQYNAFVSDMESKMAEAVPGIFDENSTVQQELVEFAESVGFDESMFFLTNPTTIVTTPDGQQEYLGEKAVSIMAMLHNLKTKLAGVSQEQARKEASEYKDVSGLATSQSTKGATPKSGMLSEAEFAKLSPTEQERYLAGA
jgi:hypothetical protein